MFCFLGAYTPVTAGGTIVVDGVLTSCYAFNDHDLAHFAMTPIRWFPETTQWIFGVDNETPGYISILEELGKWMLPEEQLM